jgi:hypothetical protein
VCSRTVIAPLLKAGFKTMAERALGKLNGPGAIHSARAVNLVDQDFSSGWSFGRHIPEAQDRLPWRVIVPKGVKVDFDQSFCQLDLEGLPSRPT